MLEGVFNITPTPFCEDGALDLPSVQTPVDHVVRHGVDGIIILGVMGEADKLIDQERDALITATLEAVKGRVTVCVGATHAGTDGCVSYCRRAQALGASAVMVAPPGSLGPPTRPCVGTTSRWPARSTCPTWCRITRRAATS